MMTDGEVIWECGPTTCLHRVIPPIWNGESYEPGEVCDADAVPHTDRCEEHGGEELEEQWAEDWDPYHNEECEHTP